VRKLALIGLAQALLLVSGCGGGSSGGTPSASTSNNGSGNSGGQAGNTITMTVDAGPDSSVGYDVDTPFITVTVCAPGSSSNCQVIDHVEVDTGSFGLRILSSALGSSLASALQQEVGSDGNPIVECTQFADGFTWGPVKIANVQVAGESASNVPIQVMGDPAYAQSSTSGGTSTSEIPTTCSSHGPEEDTLGTFGANAIIGLGVFSADCGSECKLAPGQGNPGYYYECPASGWSPANPCSETALSESAQVTNPVFLFQTDNNGVVIELPSVKEGASSTTGTLIFGIGTEGNNSVDAKTLLTADSSYGDVGTSYTTQDGNQEFLPYSYFDTGSNAYYFADGGIPSSQGCSSYPGFNSKNPDSWFCPASELNLSATNTGQNGTQATVSFSIGNAYTLFNGSSSGTLFSDLGASSGPELSFCTAQATASAHTDCAFDFGFPFFLGRNVYIAYAGANTAWGTGPYYAY
jgi:hypothetical protein